MRLLWNYILGKIKRDFPNVPTITTDALADWLNDDSKADPILLDVRAKSEFDVSHLENAIHAPDAAAVARQIQLHANQNDGPNEQGKVQAVVYCSVGYRSAKAAQELMNAGVTGVLNLEGSIFQWANEDRPVFQGTRVVDEVHPYSRFWKRLLLKK